MTFETIDVSMDSRGVMKVALARPEKHNAMNARMIAELTQVAELLAANSAVRVVVLAGKGRTFCAGGDLDWMRAQAEKEHSARVAEALSLASMLGGWNSLSKPVIARVHGAAYGGGLGLISVCDIVIAEQCTRFALTETRLGLIPATIGPFVVRRLGEAFARQVFFNAKAFDVDFLIRAGLVARGCLLEELDAAVEEEVSALLQCAPGAVSAAKSLCRSLSGIDPAEAAEMSATALASRWETGEAKEGIAAFFAKETPSWRREHLDGEALSRR